MSNNRSLMTIRERIEALKNPHADSPEDAAAKVSAIADTEVFDMIEGIGSYIGTIPHSVLFDTYRDYCVMIKDEVKENLERADKSPFESKYGNTVVDEVLFVAVALATLPDRLEGSPLNLHINYDLRMSLGDYLNALIDISVREDGTSDSTRAERYRKLQEELSESIDLSKPLCKAIGGIVNQYREPKEKLDRTARIIDCGYKANCTIQEIEMREEYLENEYTYSDLVADVPQQDETVEVKPVEVDETPVDEIPPSPETCPVSFVTGEGVYDGSAVERLRKKLQTKWFEKIEKDPIGYFLSQAKAPSSGINIDFENVGDNFGGWEYALLLRSDDCSPEALRAKADKMDIYLEFRALIGETATDEVMSDIFRQIDTVIGKLYRLLIEPFTELDKYHFERHIV